MIICIQYTEYIFKKQRGFTDVAANLILEVITHEDINKRLRRIDE